MVERAGHHRRSDIPDGPISEIFVAGYLRVYMDGSEFLSHIAGSKPGWFNDIAIVTMSRIIDTDVPVATAVGDSGGLGVGKMLSRLLG